MHLLFVCSRARRRSATAEEIFDGTGSYEAVAAGTAADADVPIDADLLAWADLVFVMEPIHRERLSQRFPEATRHKKLVVLSIPDRYERMSPELIRQLRKRVGRTLPELR